ncbi:MAG: hypothetical protein DRN12_00660 [Thermoplasmata archaeon]|nr:MAG: hypothetical protein DRN12_00660 [Thermoplasmata archaeon]
MNSFQSHKKIILKELREEIDNGGVDTKVIPILEAINSIPRYYTTSSCAGRILLLELPKLGDKQNAVFLGRWHDKVSRNDILSAVSNASHGSIWFLTQSPIFHIAAEDLDSSVKLLKIGYAAGFKHSGLKNIENRIIVELLSTERIDVPIGRDGILLCNDKLLDFIVENANYIIERSDDKLLRLQKEISTLKL